LDRYGRGYRRLAFDCDLLVFDDRGSSGGDLTSLRRALFIVTVILLLDLDLLAEAFSSVDPEVILLGSAFRKLEYPHQYIAGCTYHLCFSEFEAW
jgi:hypothetical protein